jgi:hypothetical protein
MQKVEVKICGRASSWPDLRHTKEAGKLRKFSIRIAVLEPGFETGTSRHVAGMPPTRQ